MTTTMHDYPRRGADTTCCDRPRNELPLGEGMTSDPKHVTCTGTFEPALMAHEVHPHPSEDPYEAPELTAAARYHAARALAMYNDDIDHPGWHERLLLAVTERGTAWHVAALARGLAGDEAMRYVHLHNSDETNELLYDLCVELGVELDRIKPYPLPAQKKTQPAPAEEDPEGSR